MSSWFFISTCFCLRWLAYSPSVRAVVEGPMAKRTCRPGRMKLLFQQNEKQISVNFGGWKTATKKKHFRSGDVILIHLTTIQWFNVQYPIFGGWTWDFSWNENKIGSKKPSTWPCLSSNTATCISTSGKPSSNPRATQRSVDFCIKCRRCWATFRACWSSQGKLQTLEFLLPLGRWVFFKSGMTIQNWPFELTCFWVLHIEIWYIHIMNVYECVIIIVQQEPYQ